jgi:hypothetical protein
VNWDDPRGAFLEARGDVLVPRRHAASGWGDVLNGRTLAALVAWGVERDHADADYQVARLTVDMFRAAPLVPLTVTTAAVRSGHRVRVVDVSVRSEDAELTRGSVVMLRRGEEPPGHVPAPPEWDAPRPDDLPAPTERRPPWESRRFDRSAWIREYFELVEGEPLTPLLRVALACDITNALANTGDRGLGYINADLTLYLARLPAGEWVGCEPTGHGAAAGVSFATASMYDLGGRIGHVAMSAVADPRMIRPAES